MTSSNRRNPVGGTVVAILTVVLIAVLNKPMGSLPALGRLLDPNHGAMANAEPVNENFTDNLNLKQVGANVAVWFDDRLVPHIHASNEHDLFFVEGYVHACFRLWQMDMETRAAAGQISEVVGDKALRFDRKQRRKGMIFAAENSLRAMEAEPRTKHMLDAYTEGINARMAGLRYKDYPLEYKLMGFEPTPWTNLRTVLLLKYMADDLTGKSDDIALTYLRDILPPGMLNYLFPERVQGSSPVIPAGTAHDKASLTVPKAPADSVAFSRFIATDFGDNVEHGKGSNNWVLSGSKTASGAPILCNDPHLGLNLPSLWYEIQLQAPGINVYGASLPGTPGVVIGFNENISWGFTNNYRDVKDFYVIKPVVGDKTKYWFDGQQLPYTVRLERIKIKGLPDMVDTVRYTVHGPLIYDESFHESEGMNKPLAMTWMAHKPTNEMLAIYLMDKASNYNEFVDAILNFQCPAQNMAYADRGGNIALWGQGQFVNKWPEQGRFVMNGQDSSTLWHELIPMRENPHVLNPQQGYVASANQCVTDSTYPYWYNGDFVELRGWRINHVLTGIQKATVKDMFALQNDTYSELAAGALPVMLKQLPELLTPAQQKYATLLQQWDYKLGAESAAASVFQVWWAVMHEGLWKNVVRKAPGHFMPLPERTMQLIQSPEFLSSNLAGTPVNTRIKRSFVKAMDSVATLEKTIGLDWNKVKNSTVAHLTKLAPFGYDHLKTGGWGNTVNAMKGDHGPSWRMVVQMGKDIEAYGVYPGGQSGNPGSKYYANFLPHWASGQYYKLLFLPNAGTQTDKTIKYTWTIHQ